VRRATRFQARAASLVGPREREGAARAGEKVPLLQSGEWRRGPQAAAQRARRVASTPRARGAASSPEPAL
jgi:hypothetical protein